MRKIIVIAYQLHYSKGSEFSIAWDFITHVSRYNHLTVLYGTSGKHHDVGDTVEMEAFCKSHHFDHITFIPVKPSFKTKNYDYLLLGQTLLKNRGTGTCFTEKLSQ